jgi:hypothetical protein
MTFSRKAAAILAGAAAVFVYLGLNARVPPLAMNLPWLWTLTAVLIASAAICGRQLQKATRFSWVEALLLPLQ